MRQIAERDLRRLAHNLAVVSLRAPLSPSSPICEGGKGQLQQPCVKVLGLEHSATLSTNNLELIRSYRDRATLSSKNLASFYYSRGRYFETSCYINGCSRYARY